MLVYLCILLDYGSHKINQNTKATISVVVGLPGLVPSPSCGKTGRDGCRAKRIGPSTPDIFILQKVRNEILNLEKMYWRDRIGDQFLVLCIFWFREKTKKIPCTEKFLEIPKMYIQTSGSYYSQQKSSCHFNIKNLNVYCFFFAELH